VLNLKIKKIKIKKKNSIVVENFKNLNYRNLESNHGLVQISMLGAKRMTTKTRKEL
jgi:hypothetical protein